MKLMKKIPVFLHTDIGGDIDDTWALGFLMRSPEVELKFILSAVGDTRYRAKIIAKMLETADYTGTTVGMGVRVPTIADHLSLCYHKRQAAWIEDYSLEKFPGKVHENGVEAFVKAVMASEETPCVLSIGPLPNIARALEIEPRIASKCRFVGMQGSIRLGYFGSSVLSAEYNVMYDPAAVRKVFSAPWKDILITPLDTCGYITLEGPLYQQIRESKDPVAWSIIENDMTWRNDEAKLWESRSTLLCDTVAAYLVFDESLVETETLPVIVTDDGFTKIDPIHGRPIRVATAWRDLETFKKMLADRIAGLTG